jgi:2,4-dienoyl-CoA reductase-like NADH-dependent reductase (Old Yellow Enzyme family)
VGAYGAAARRCREGGMDGIEIEAYGHLLDAFWSPATNRRADDYGGSLDNRMRFALEVLDEIRAQVGSDYLVGIAWSSTRTWRAGSRARKDSRSHAACSRPA